MNTALELVHGGVQLHRVLAPHADAVLDALGELAGTSRFPGPSPCSLERSDFAKLRARGYWVCEKTDGVRVLMFCTRVLGEDVCCLVDRAMAVWLLPLRHVPTLMFQGSIVDCELALNRMTGAWELLAFDAYVLGGAALHGLPFSARIASVKRTMAVHVPDPADPVRWVLKDFASTEAYAGPERAQALELLRSKRAAYDVDGLVLTPEDAPPVVGRCADLLKLKTRHTVDFLVGNNGADLGVYDPARRDHVTVARLSVQAQPGAVVECEWDQMAWKLVCVRLDKTTANDKLTYTKTLVNIRENITEQELFNVFT